MVEEEEAVQEDSVEMEVGGKGRVADEGAEIWEAGLGGLG